MRTKGSGNDFFFFWFDENILKIKIIFIFPVPIAPKDTETLITVNSTVAWIRLDQWLVNGCEIKYFLIKYRSKIDKEWLAISSKISPNEQRLVELIDLHPATWYILNMAAITDIGTTEQTYSFATLTIDGGRCFCCFFCNNFNFPFFVLPKATLSPLDTPMLMQASSGIGYPSSSKTSTTMMTINPIQSMTILIPATCSVIVLTVIILVACFVIRIKRQQHFNHSLGDGATGGPDDEPNNSNVQILHSTNINHHHQGKEFNNDLPRYVDPIGTKNLDHCGLCDGNVGVKHLMKSEYNTHNNNRKEDIEMLDNGQNSSDPNYATLKNPIHLMRTQRTACIKSSKLRSTHHTMMMPMKSAIKNHNPNGFGLKNQTKNRISNNNNDNNHHQNDNNQNNNNNLIANTKPNISPMIWLLVSCWKLNLVIN